MTSGSPESTRVSISAAQRTGPAAGVHSVSNAVTLDRITEVRRANESR